MPGVSRVGVDIAGGVIIGELAPKVKVEGAPIVCQFAPVAAHGRPPHRTPVMIGASSKVFANGIPICRLGDPASCGHPATGSSKVIAG